MAGQEASAQDGFNIGFKQSVSAGYNSGIVRGVTSAMNCLSNELKERLVETEEKRHKLKQLHESVLSLSTSDALKLFHEEQSRQEHQQYTARIITPIAPKFQMKVF